MKKSWTFVFSSTCQLIRANRKSTCEHLTPNPQTNTTCLVIFLLTSAAPARMSICGIQTKKYEHQRASLERSSVSQKRSLLYSRSRLINVVMETTSSKADDDIDSQGFAVVRQTGKLRHQSAEFHSTMSNNDVPRSSNRDTFTRFPITDSNVNRLEST